jgi:DNA-binding CsgD family transcriptional regulator
MKIFMNDELECQTGVSIDELKAQYRYCVRKLQKKRDKINEELISLMELIQRAEKQGYEEFLDKLISQQTEWQAEKESIGWMIGNLEYALEWMETYRRPGNRRGVERLAAYQREKPMDPLIMQRYIEHVGVEVYPWMDREQKDTISLADRQRIEDALSVLTDREREAYLMTRGNGTSFGDAAHFMKVTKSTVQTLVKRAEAKIAYKINKMTPAI